MFIFLVLCTFLQTLRGASLPSHAGSSFTTVDMLSFVARETPAAPEKRSQQLRTVQDIMKSCLWTIIACVWTSAHPNINGPRDSGWTCMKRKVVTMITAIMVPDLVLYWALKQHWAAKDIAAKYNKEFARAEETETPFWRKIFSWFQTLPKDTTRRSNGQSWTKTHGFFIQMGGFILYKNEYPKEVLDYGRLAELLREKAIDIPIVTERDIQDRSKGDAVSKSIVVLQTTWFVLQCVGRAAEHLPLSELEVLTLAFAVLNVAIYAAWWNKPQGVGTAICVPLTSAEEEQHELANLYHPEPGNLPHQHSHDDLHSISPDDQQQHNTTTRGWHIILHGLFPAPPPQDRHPIAKFIYYIFLIVSLLLLPINLFANVAIHIYVLMLHQWGKLSGSIPDAEIKRDALRVPMFHVAKVDSLGTTIVSCIIGTIFGAVHLLAWESGFPFEANRRYWRMAATVLTVAPSVVLIATMIKIFKLRDDPKWGDINLVWVPVMIVTYVSLAILIVFYFAARFAVMIIALISIRDPPHDILLDVSWTSQIPHLWYK